MKKISNNIGEIQWLFEGNPFDVNILTEKYEGFVYLIINKSNLKRYIGRKYLYQIRKVKNKKNRVRTESDWKFYYSSSETLRKEIEELGKDNFEFHILSFHKTRGDCNRSEVELLWKCDVLYSNNVFYNDSIGNYRKRPSHIIPWEAHNKYQLLGV